VDEVEFGVNSCSRAVLLEARAPSSCSMRRKSAWMVSGDGLLQPAMMTC
jgi:hypothetical protein